MPRSLGLGADVGRRREALQERAHRLRATAPVASRQLLPEVLHPDQATSLGRGDGMLERLGVLPAREVEESPGGAGEREPAEERDVVGVEAAGPGDSNASPVPRGVVVVTQIVAFAG